MQKIHIKRIYGVFKIVFFNKKKISFILNMTLLMFEASVFITKNNISPSIIACNSTEVIVKLHLVLKFWHNHCSTSPISRIILYFISGILCRLFLYT